jgi:hypothetical protein
MVRKPEHKDVLRFCRRLLSYLLFCVFVIFLVKISIEKAHLYWSSPSSFLPATIQYFSEKFEEYFVSIFLGFFVGFGFKNFLGLKQNG